MKIRDKQVSISKTGMTQATRIVAAIEQLPKDLPDAGLRDDAGALPPPALPALIGAEGCGCLAAASPELP